MRKPLRYSYHTLAATSVAGITITRIITVRTSVDAIVFATIELCSH